jgi:hypothetical protein
MQSTVNLPDEIAVQVKARGLTPEDYVERLIAERVSALTKDWLDDEQSPAEFNASLDALARYSDKIPQLPIDAFSRTIFMRITING